jgi:predicted transposase YbfD/YdcC
MKLESPLRFFKDLPDYRDTRYVKHSLLNIIAISLSAIICGASDWYDVEDYGIENEDFLRKFLDLGKHGVPSHDTFNRFYSYTDPVALEQSFSKWVAAICDLTEGRIINIDGKTLRGSKTSGKDDFVHMVSAWCNTNGMVIGQEKVASKSNEITAIPELLEMLVVKGGLFTIDAMGCQEKIAEKIVAKEGDYVLAVKENQPSLMDDIKKAFENEEAASIETFSEIGHGRTEKRTTSVINKIDCIGRPERWAGLKSIVRVNTERENKKTGKKEEGVRYYISSKNEKAGFFNNAVRIHWSIENKLHWQLDVSFGEDNSKKMQGNSAQNFSLLNKIALSMINHHKDEGRGAKKISVKRKRKMAGWNNEYLIGIILSYDFG